MASSQHDGDGSAQALAGVHRLDVDVEPVGFRWSCAGGPDRWETAFRRMAGRCRNHLAGVANGPSVYAHKERGWPSAGPAFFFLDLRKVDTTRHCDVGAGG